MAAEIVPRIEALTLEQEAELPRFRQEYLDSACSGGRIDRDQLQSALNDAYAEIGKPAPQLLFFDSPAACVLAIKICEKGELPKFNSPEPLQVRIGVQLRERLEGQLQGRRWGLPWDRPWAEFEYPLGDHLGAQFVDRILNPLVDELEGELKCRLGDQLWDQLRNQLWGELNDQLWDQLWGRFQGQLWDQFGKQLWVELWGELRGQIGGQLRNSGFSWGSQDFYWIAFGKFAERIGVQLPASTSRQLDILDRIGRQCEWWWPFENVVIASQKPLFVKWDEEGRLHCADGPAVAYADGYSLYARHGTRLPTE